MNEEAWYPNQISTTYVNNIPEAKVFRELIPFAQERQLSVIIPKEEDLTDDCLIGDIVSVNPDIGNNL